MVFCNQSFGHCKTTADTGFLELFKAAATAKVQNTAVASWNASELRPRQSLLVACKNSKQLLGSYTYIYMCGLWIVYYKCTQEVQGLQVKGVQGMSGKSLA